MACHLNWSLKPPNGPGEKMETVLTGYLNHLMALADAGHYTVCHINWPLKAPNGPG